MKKITLTRSRPPKPGSSDADESGGVQLRRKNRRSQIMTPEQVAAEERREHEKKILHSAAKFHTHMIAQLCVGGGKDPDAPNLIRFDAGRYALEQAHPELPHPTPWIVAEMDRIARLTRNHIRYMRQRYFPTGEITLVSNESAAPVICPQETVGRHRALVFHSQTVLQLGMLEKLQDLDQMIRDALLLKKFGYLPDGEWQYLSAVVGRFVYVLRHTHDIDPIR